mgnify:CR=1 FL=1
MTFTPIDGSSSWKAVLLLFLMMKYTYRCIFDSTSYRPLAKLRIPILSTCVSGFKVNNGHILWELYPCTSLRICTSYRTIYEQIFAHGVDRMEPYVVAKEELTLVAKHVMLPFAVAVLERDIQVLPRLKVKVPDVYTAALDEILQKTYQDISSTRRMLREQRIKVSEVERDVKGALWEYYVRGYRHEYSKLWTVMRAEVEIYLAEKLGIPYPRPAD